MSEYDLQYSASSRLEGILLPVIDPGIAGSFLAHGSCMPAGLTLSLCISKKSKKAVLDRCASVARAPIQPRADHHAPMTINARMGY